MRGLTARGTALPYGQKTNQQAQIVRDALPATDKVTPGIRHGLECGCFCQILVLEEIQNEQSHLHR